MNHCVLEVEVKTSPTLRYTQDNKTPVAEVDVQFDALRKDDSPSEIKVVGWGSLAEDLQNRVKAGQRIVIEGRLRMNTVQRQDGSKEKKAEFTLSKIHNFSNPSSISTNKPIESTQKTASQEDNAEWNSSPLIPDTDDIPF